MNSPPAFPTPIISVMQHTGMTLRDYFAAKAMQGYMYSAPTADDINNEHGILAEMSYKLADAMLKAREA